jgi:CRISPR-associated endonuclease/helicase Cas3
VAALAHVDATIRLFSPDTFLPKTTAIYRDASLLWRSAKVIFDAGKIVSRSSPECAAPESGELRALVEAAYGQCKIAIPTGLEGAQNEAAGKASAERSQGAFNVLRFEAGYDFDGGRWDADSRVPTRIGDDTVTLRLAVFRDGRILPWALRDGSERADRRDWALSEVSVRRARCKGTPEADRQTAGTIQKAREGWTLSEQEVPILVLQPGADGRWSGAVIDGREREVMVSYSADRGLSFVG